MLRDHMFRDHHTLFTRKVLRVGDVEGCQIDKDDDTGSVESKEDTCFLDIGDCNGVQAKYDGLSSGQEATIYSLKASG